jgi:CubicO group peptidase (beta-lactamase class C family)
MLLGSTLAGQPQPRFTDPDRKSRLLQTAREMDRIVNAFFQGRGIPAMSYGMVIDGELVHTRTLGDAQRDTAFRIASMTKSFTALAVLRLRDEGKLSLEDPVSRWIPEFEKMRYPTGDTAPIRVRQLLTHGTGLPEDNPWGDRQLGESNATLSAWLNQGLPFSTPPDTQFEYSNYGFALAGQVIEKVSGRSYREYVESEILTPLGMKSSSLEPSAIPASRRAKGFGRGSDGRLFEIPSLPHGSFGAMGGLVTTADDLAKWIAFQLSAFPPRDDPEKGPVRRSSVREMQDMHRRSEFNIGNRRASAGGYGYGLSVSEDCRFGHIVSHGGGLPGFGSFMIWLPEYGVGLFTMTNLTYTSAAGTLQDTLTAMLRTGALKPRVLPPSPVLTSMRDSIARLWREQWDDKAFAALTANNLFMDLPAAEWKQRALATVKIAGVCKPPGEVIPENWLRGKFRMECEHGWVDTEFTLAPTQPPTVQHLRFAYAGRPDAVRMKAIAAVKAPAANGACRVGPVLSGDGVKVSTVRLECDMEPANVTVDFEDRGGASSVRFSRAEGVRCAW